MGKQRKFIAPCFDQLLLVSTSISLAWWVHRRIPDSYHSGWCCLDEYTACLIWERPAKHDIDAAPEAQGLVKEARDFRWSATVTCVTLVWHLCETLSWNSHCRRPSNFMSQDVARACCNALWIQIIRCVSSCVSSHGCFQQWLDGLLKSHRFHNLQALSHGVIRVACGQYGLWAARGDTKLNF